MSIKINNFMYLNSIFNNVIDNNDRIKPQRQGSLSYWSIHLVGIINNVKTKKYLNRENEVFWYASFHLEESTEWKIGLEIPRLNSMFWCHYFIQSCIIKFLWMISENIQSALGVDLQNDAMQYIWIGLERKW